MRSKAPYADDRSPVKRLARIAYAFVVMNTAAVVAAIAIIRRKKVWR